MILRETPCKTALSQSGLYDYALNPYRGCEHACVYCYAPAILREKREWGSFVDAKINIPQVLSSELKSKPKGEVGISTVTDAYQPAEKKYEITRRCLEALLRSDFPICIQTKSSLVLRDLDLIKKFRKREVGFTITTLDDEARKKYEPFSSPVEERIAALEELASAGIDTWVFLGPIMPFITDKNSELEKLIKKLADAKVKTILIDKLRMKPGLKQKIEDFYSKHYPDSLLNYRNVNDEYYRQVKNRIIRLCSENNIRAEPCF